MASDLQLVDGQFGETITIQINKADGSPDDLTVYTDVRLKMADFDYSANVYDITQIDAEMDDSLFSVGTVLWTPSASNPIPPFGFYWLQVFREGPGNAPVRKFFVEVVRSVP